MGMVTNRLPAFAGGDEKKEEMTMACIDGRKGPK
jgi:hypothetical protein